MKRETIEKGQQLIEEIDSLKGLYKLKELNNSASKGVHFEVFKDYSGDRFRTSIKIPERLTTRLLNEVEKIVKEMEDELEALQ